MFKICEVPGIVKRLHNQVECLIILPCEPLGLEELQNTEKSGHLFIGRYRNDDRNTLPVKNVLDMKAKDNSSESIKRKIELMICLQKRIRSRTEQTRDFALTF